MFALPKKPSTRPFPRITRIGHGDLKEPPRFLRALPRGPKTTNRKKKSCAAAAKAERLSRSAHGKAPRPPFAPSLLVEHRRCPGSGLDPRQPPGPASPLPEGGTEPHTDGPPDLAGPTARRTPACGAPGSSPAAAGRCGTRPRCRAALPNLAAAAAAAAHLLPRPGPGALRLSPPQPNRRRRCCPAAAAAACPGCRLMEPWALARLPGEAGPAGVRAGRTRREPRFPGPAAARGAGGLERGRGKVLRAPGSLLPACEVMREKCT